MATVPWVDDFERPDELPIGPPWRAFSTYQGLDLIGGGATTSNASYRASVLDVDRSEFTARINVQGFGESGALTGIMFRVASDSQWWRMRTNGLRGLRLEEYDGALTIHKDWTQASNLSASFDLEVRLVGTTIIRCYLNGVMWASHSSSKFADAAVCGMLLSAPLGVDTGLKISQFQLAV